MFVVSLLVLGILVFVHELGHFVVAKLCGVGVLEFSIGFGKKIARWRLGDTTYAIGIIPLGGYVRMVGDDPRMLAVPEGKTPEGGSIIEHPSDLLEGMEERELSEDERRLLSDRSKWFLTKGFLAKFAIVFAGPLFNVLFALFLAVATFSFWGVHKPVTLPIVGEMVLDGPAAKAGLMRDDYVRQIDSVQIVDWAQLAKTVQRSEGREMAFTVERRDQRGESQLVEIRVTGIASIPEFDLIRDDRIPVNSFMIGIMPKMEREKIAFADALRISPSYLWGITEMTYRGLFGMVVGAISTKHIAGPVFIFGEAARTARRGAADLVDFMIILSMSLALFNLLPVPVLDGGHLVFFIIEAIRGAPVSVKVQQVATQLGMCALFALMLFAISNDVLRALGK